MFPEGHITLDGEIKEFKRGYERIVRGLAVPIIPIGIEGVWGHWLSCKNGDAFRTWDTDWRPKVSIRVGAPIWEPITPEELRLKVIALATEGAGATAADAVSPELA
jgi:1-acyl-sn-glycerol-3-phosphate acyltransferase